MKNICSQSRLQHQSRQQSKTTVSFDSFIFVDNLTNSKIILKDARRQYQSRQKLKRSVKDHKIKQVKDLHQCIQSLKTTKLFQLNSLRNKLFKSTHHSRNPTFDNLQNQHETINQTRHGLRKLIDMSINEVSIKEMRQCIQNPSKSVNPQIMALQSFKGYSLTKGNLLRLIKKVQNKRQGTKTPSPSLLKQEQEIEIKEEEQLREKIEHYIAANRGNSTYLVQPDNKHQLYEKLYSACIRKRQKMKKKTTIKANLKIQDEGIFKPIKAGQKIDNIQRRIQQKQNHKQQSLQEQEILYSVQNNLFFDLQFLSNTNKNLIYTTDKNGNSLLHIATKSRNVELFDFILKRAGPQSLQIRNNLGKTPLDLAKLYGVSLIVQKILNYSPFG